MADGKIILENVGKRPFLASLRSEACMRAGVPVHVAGNQTLYKRGDDGVRRGRTVKRRLFQSVIVPAGGRSGELPSVVRYLPEVVAALQAGTLRIIDAAPRHAKGVRQGPRNKAAVPATPAVGQEGKKE